jgi:hypothetical protein
MRPDGMLKHLAICAVMAVIFYVAAFAWIEHRRIAQGPWEVAFRADAAGTPALLISQTNLHISETILFAGQTVRPAPFSRTIVFRPPPPDLPFGQVLYQDPAFLPGTVTMRLFGHTVELLPRVLSVDKKEYPWRSGAVLQVR